MSVITDKQVLSAIRETQPDPSTPANWPRQLRCCITRAKQVGVEVPWDSQSDPLDVWMRLNYALSLRARKVDKPEEYFITFTVPDKEEHRDPKRVLFRALTFAKRYSAQFSWCLELTKSGFPHVHMLVKPNTTYLLSTVKKKINSMNLNFGQGKWMQKARRREQVLSYMSKIESKPNQAYLDKWGLNKNQGDLEDLKKVSVLGDFRCDM